MYIWWSGIGGDIHGREWGERIEGEGVGVKGDTVVIREWVRVHDR